MRINQSCGKKILMLKNFNIFEHFILQTFCIFAIQTFL